MIVGDTTILRLGQRGEIDLATVGSRVVYDVRAVNAAVLQISMPGTAWASGAVVEAKYSLDGINFISFATPSTLSAYGATDILTVSGVPYLCLETTTEGSGTSPVHAWVNAHGVTT